MCEVYALINLILSSTFLYVNWCELLFFRFPFPVLPFSIYNSDVGLGSVFYGDCEV